MAVENRMTAPNVDHYIDSLGDINYRKVDVCLVTSKVDYEPPYDVNTSFAEAFRSFAPKKDADESGDAGE